MGGLKDIFMGMSKIVGAAEDNLSSKVNGIAYKEGGDLVQGGAGTDGATGAGAGPAAGAGAGGAAGPGAGASENGLQTQELLALQYDVQRFSIFNNMATSTMQTVAGAYQSVTGNLNFR